MFITILTLGIAGVLGELAQVVRHVERQGRDRLLVAGHVPGASLVAFALQQGRDKPREAGAGSAIAGRASA